MNSIRNICIGLIVLTVAGCSAREVEPDEKIDVTAVTVDAHDGFVHQLARVYSTADVVRIAAGVADLAAPSTLEHDVYMLRQEMDMALELERGLPNRPLPGEDTLAGDVADRMRENLFQAEQQVQTTEAMVREGNADGNRLAEAAVRIEGLIESVSREHAALVPLITDPEFAVVEFESIRPEHSVSSNLSAAAATLKRMLTAEAEDETFAWVDSWRANGDAIGAHLEAARTGLVDLGEIDSTLPLAPMEEAVTEAAEQLATLRVALVEGTPDRERTRAAALDLLDAIGALEQQYRSVVEGSNAVYPEYDFGEI